MPHTVRLPYISLSVANVDAVTVQSRVAGLVTIVPTLSRCVVSRIRLKIDVRLLPQEMRVKRPGGGEAVGLGAASELDHAGSRRVGLQDDPNFRSLLAWVGRRLLSSAYSTVRPYASIATSSAARGESSIEAWEIGGSDWAKIMAVGMIGRSRGVVQRAAGDRLTITATGLADRRLRDVDERGMKHGRHGAEDLPDLHRATQFIGCRSAGSRRIVEHRGECPGVQVTLVELHLGAARYSRDHAGHRVHPADGGDAAAGDGGSHGWPARTARPPPVSPVASPSGSIRRVPPGR